MTRYGKVGTLSRARKKDICSRFCPSPLILRCDYQSARQGKARQGKARQGKGKKDFGRQGKTTELNVMNVHDM